VDNLWGVLGYDKVAAQLAEALHESAALNVIEGPPGVGKSSLAKMIGGLWESGGGSAILAEGDVLKSEAPYYPFGFAMGGLPSAWRSVGLTIAGVARAGEVLLGTAGLITTTVEALAALARTRSRRRRTPLLGDTEQGILHELDQLGGRKQILLIADNLHWWDAQSLDLLLRLRDERMWDAFPFLAELRVLAVQTVEPYQSVAHTAAHETVLAPASTNYFRLDRVPRDTFGEVLVALGAPSVSSEVADIIYSLSGGHLALASRCAARLAAGEADLLLAAGRSEDFVERLLSERIVLLGAVGRQALAMLQMAAVLGLTFRRDEVVCVSELPDSDVSQVLRYCRDESLLELTDGLGRFAHDFYRQHFLTLGPADRVAIHERLSECLRMLRPGEYELRCLNAVSAERPAAAATLAVHAVLQAERDAGGSNDLGTPILDAIQAGQLETVRHGLSDALVHLNGYRFAECIQTLDRLPRDLPKSLLAEADYLRAMCLMSTRSEDDRANGRSLLESWAGYEDQEPEIGIRLMQLLLYGRAHLREKEPGWQLESRMRHVLVDRAAFDAAAKDALYTLDRCAGALYQSDVALVRHEEARTYFGGSTQETTLRRPLEYYRCLVNLGASLIGVGRYRNAVEVYAEAENLVSRYTPGVFPRVDYPRMNRLLAEVRLGVVDAARAEALQREIVDGSGVESDPFYTGNAAAVYSALSGNLGAAIARLDSLEVELTRTRSEPEPGMVYLLGANRCAARYAAGDTRTAQAEWDMLSGLVDRMVYPSRPIYVRRHELLRKIMDQGEVMAPAAFDQVLLTQYPDEFGPLWDHYGRGFWLPAIEFWREN
jgi:tetratricopeptide (TPR) repeat protein